MKTIPCPECNRPLEYLCKAKENFALFYCPVCDEGHIMKKIGGFSGKINEFLIHNGALSADRIKKLKKVIENIYI